MCELTFHLEQYMDERQGSVKTFLRLSIKLLLILKCHLSNNGSLNVLHNTENIPPVQTANNKHCIKC